MPCCCCCYHHNHLLPLAAARARLRSGRSRGGAAVAATTATTPSSFPPADDVKVQALKKWSFFSSERGADDAAEPLLGACRATSLPLPADLVVPADEPEPKR